MPNDERPDDPPEPSEDDTERDEDAGPTLSAEQWEESHQRDQAEG